MALQSALQLFWSLLKQNFFSYKGRASRLEMLVKFAGIQGGCLLFGFCGGLMVGLFVALLFGNSAVGTAVTLTLFILMLIPMQAALVAVYVRRLHDLGFSGWWSAVWFVAVLFSSKAMFPTLIGSILWGALLCLFLVPGQKEPNRFG